MTVCSIQVNVEFENGGIVRYDKRNRTPAMRHIDYGLGAFDRSVFAKISAGQKYDLADIYQNLLEDGDLAAFEVHERF
jgi:NDP-sugar pyrophosphorylase family protein